jgi:hypothetical protein
LAANSIFVHLPALSARQGVAYGEEHKLVKNGLFSANINQDLSQPLLA